MTRSTSRAALGGVALAAMAAGAVWAGDLLGVHERPASDRQMTKSPFGPAVDRGDAAVPATSRRRSQPYWMAVRRFAGPGPLTTPTFAIDERALQWRVVWRCQRARLLIRPERPSGDDLGGPLAQAEECPARGEGRSVAQGAFRLRVATGGPWRARVEEQLDVPLIEPPTAAMREPQTRVVARGRLYGIDEEGSGTVTVYQEPDGALSLRLADFYVTPDADLRLRLSSLERPTSTRQVDQAPHRDVAFLKATTGSLNLRLPAGALRRGMRSVVIWSEITRNAYAAARLRP